MFIDEAQIHVQSGRGGDGCLSFRREKFEAFGGPDGGNGGDGGDVVLCARAGIDTLLDFAGKHHWKAPAGAPGQGSDCTGKNGENLMIDLPVGTLVFDMATGILLKDLAEPDEQCCVARGGKGGRGNRSFATATCQAPRQFEPGGSAEERDLRLELKLVADVGLVGLPNAGKSTLLSRVSKARPKIADYPFTTLKPQLGICELSGERRMVFADIPGLIRGAHTGAGLGDAFLRHIERTRLIVHLVDICPADGTKPADAYRVIREELSAHSERLAQTPEIVVANKVDLGDAREAIETLARQTGSDVMAISAVTGQGISALTEQLWSRLGGSTRIAARRFDLPVAPHLRPDA